MSYKPTHEGSRVSAGTGEDGMFSYQIDDKDVSDADGFGAAIGFDGDNKKIFEGSQTVFGGVGKGKPHSAGKYRYNKGTEKVEKVV